MVMSIKSERAHLQRDELELVAQTHYPSIVDLDDGAISSTLTRIRDLRSKERSVSREMRRSIRGKGETRGSSFPGNVEKPLLRKQIFSGALKRLNREVSRRRVLNAKDELIAASRRALELKTANENTHRPEPGQSNSKGMTPIDNERRRTKVNRSKVGSVSQATKSAQAARDARA